MNSHALRRRAFLAIVTPSNALDFVEQAMGGDELAMIALTSTTAAAVEAAGRGDKLCGCCAGDMPPYKAPPAIGVFVPLPPDPKRPAITFNVCKACLEGGLEEAALMAAQALDPSAKFHSRG